VPEVSVFDAYRASRALKPHLAADDRIELVASDDITSDYWVLTRQELFVLRGDTISRRLPLEHGAVSLRTTAAGVELRVRDTRGGAPLAIASFRRGNKFTDRITSTMRVDDEIGDAQ
jgi:hypothetical protein